MDSLLFLFVRQRTYRNYNKSYCRGLPDKEQGVCNGLSSFVLLLGNGGGNFDFHDIFWNIRDTELAHYGDFVGDTADFEYISLYKGADCANRGERRA